MAIEHIAASIILALSAAVPGKTSCIELPAPRTDGTVSLEKAIVGRRSVRAYRKKGLSLRQVSQLLWAAQGVTDREKGFRAAPSAGATYPLTAYLVAGDVEGLAPGVYRYLPKRHALERVSQGDMRDLLTGASHGQAWVAKAPASIVLAAAYERTTRVYGKRGARYVDIEVGHAGENIYLQAEALGLGTVAVGAFDGAAVRKIMGIDETPVYIMPVGVK